MGEMLHSGFQGEWGHLNRRKGEMLHSGVQGERGQLGTEVEMLRNRWRGGGVQGEGGRLD